MIGRFVPLRPGRRSAVSTNPCLNQNRSDRHYMEFSSTKGFLCSNEAELSLFTQVSVDISIYHGLRLVVSNGNSTKFTLKIYRKAANHGTVVRPAF